MTARSGLGLAMSLLFVAVTVAGLWNTRGAAINNGDEAIYAGLAREMVRSGELVDLRWQGAPIIQRPPMAVWWLAAWERAAGEDRGVRWANATAAGLAAAMVAWLGATLYSVGAGAAAGALFGSSDLLLGYARF